MRNLWRGWVLLVVVSGALGAQTGPAGWVVRPEWVKAHEDFLASDAMRGRGSATHDEEVAATYVASEYEAYGLKPAPGMTRYLQTAQVQKASLDGHAQLTGGAVALQEGTGFALMRSSGEGVQGPLLKATPTDGSSVAHRHGAVLLLSGAGDPRAVMRLLRGLRGTEIRLVLLPAEGGLGEMFKGLGGETQVPVTLAGAPSEPEAFPTIALLQPAALQAMATLAEGTPVSLEVHRQPAAPRNTYNAVGYLPGKDPTAGTILLTAHLDHLGIGREVNGDALYNGANDDASGTTAVLELAHALAAGPRLRRSVLFVCYGSEELGELGSTYFGQHPPVPLKDLVANLEFEMIGNQDPKMPAGVLLLTGWDRSDLGPTLRAHGALVGPDPYPEQHFFERSDNYALALEGVVAHTAAGWGTPPTYHQPDDDLAHLNLPFMTAAIQSLVEPVRWLASSDFVPAWTRGGRPSR